MTHSTRMDASSAEAIGETAILDATAADTPRTRSESRSLRHLSSIWLGRIAFFAIMVAGWHLASGSIVDPFFVSRPSDIWRELSGMVTSGSLLLNTLATLQEAAI